MKRVLFALFGLLLSVPAHAAALPSGYTELTYVNMPVGAYLTTNIVPQGDYRIELDFATTSFPSTGTSLFGTRPTTSAGSGIQLGLGTTGQIALDGLGTRYNPTTLATINTRYKYVWNNKNVTLTSGSTTIGSYTFTGAETQTYPFVLNGLNNAGTVGGGKVGIYLYSFKVWNAQGELVADLIPAKNSSGVVGMYDTVSGQFFTNSGSGSFLPGEELSPCRNLFDKAQTPYQSGSYISSATVGQTGFSTTTNTNYNVYRIEIQPNTTYTFGKIKANNPYWVVADSSDEVLQTATNNGGTEGVDITITTEASAKYLYLSVSINGTYKCDDILQIEQGSTATPYVPYDAQCGGCSGGGTRRNYVSATGTGTQVGTPTPENPIDPVFFRQGRMVLRAVGSGENLVADSYDASTGKITRRVGVRVLDGTEDWAQVNKSTYPHTYNADNVITDRDYTKRVGLSSHFINTNTVSDLNTAGMMYLGASSQRINFAMSNDYTSIAQFKQYLAAQYAAGTPVTVYYPLATPVVEDWDGGATYCESGIKIATNLYNSAKFQNVIDALDTAVSTINNIVAGTIAQANSIGELASGKQTRPNPADSSDTTCPTSCPNYRQCLLVEKDDGTPCWYEINDPFYNFTRPIIGANLNATSYTYANGVPSNYTQLEYIESTGTQYIDTGVVPTVNTNVKLTAQYTDFYTGADAWNSIAGSAGGAGNNRFYPLGTTNGSTPNIRQTYGSNQYEQPKDTNIHTVDFNNANKQIIVDGVNVGSTTSGFEPVSGQPSILLFLTWHKTSGKVWPSKARIYTWTVYENGTLIQNLVPAKNSSNVVGMYDTVSGQFFTNAGTGDFVAGNPVPNQQATWSATWPASVANNFAGGTAYGEIMCNNVQGTWRAPATTSQMNNANWNTPGQYCWCGMKNIYNGNENVPVPNNVWVFAYSSSVQYTTINACYANCARRCGQKVYDDMLFTQSVFGM